MKKVNSKLEGWISIFGFIFFSVAYIYFDFEVIPKIQALVFDLKIEEDSIIRSDHNILGMFLFIGRFLTVICFVICSIGFLSSDRQFVSYFKYLLYIFFFWLFIFFISLPYWILFEKDAILANTLFHKTKYQYKDIIKYDLKKGSKFPTLHIYFSEENKIVIAGSDKIPAVLKLIKENKNK